MHIDCRCDLGRCLVIEALCNTPGAAAAMHMALCPGSPAARGSMAVAAVRQHAPRQGTGGAECVNMFRAEYAASQHPGSQPFALLQKQPRETASAVCRYGPFGKAKRHVSARKTARTALPCNRCKQNIPAIGHGATAHGGLPGRPCAAAPRRVPHATEGIGLPPSKP